MPIRTHHIFPVQFPAAWASDWGEDEFGLFQAFTYRGVRQGFRWIEPGSFLMGSPPKVERERGDDEKPHAVRLSKGFWLAETTVSQALWIAVMGKNPSRFQDDAENPVEQVSWPDAQTFIARLNALEPELSLRLPTEAEWEYACRAGSTGPYWWGAEVSPDLANYDGKYAYNHGKKGVFRGKTMPVRSLNPNPWGLFQVHGNVWEWCADWYGAYPAYPADDPQGPPTGVRRVLRGGSWRNYGRHCRSAYRSHNEPSHQWKIIGFRLARGQ